MKKTIYTVMTVLGAGLALLAACTKNIKDTTPLVADLDQQAKIQIYNATLNTQRNFLLMDGNALSGAPMVFTQTTATNITHTGQGLIYAVQPGTRNFILKDTSSSTTQPEVAFNMNLQPNNFYSIFTYDSMNAIKVVNVPTTIVIPDTGTARVRFTNLTYVKGGLPGNVDVFSRNKNANIFSNIALAQVTDFINLPTFSSDQLIVREAGTLNALDTASFSPTQKRSYTLVFRGRYNFNEAGNAFFPRTLVNFTNY
jgi:hypothetical protein